jgi:hypothetical protein
MTVLRSTGKTPDEGTRHHHDDKDDDDDKTRQWERLRHGVDEGSTPLAPAIFARALSSSSRTTASQRRRFSVELSTEALFQASASDVGGSAHNHGDVNAEGPRTKDEPAKEGGESSSSRASSSSGFHGAYADIRRSMIDYTYHVRYRKERQWLHDSIIVDILESSGAPPGGGGSNNSGSSYHDDGGGDNSDEDCDEAKSDDHNDGGSLSSSSSSSSVKILECATRHWHGEGGGGDGGSSSSNVNRCCEEQNGADVCHPWFILTVGPQGAGKRYTVEQLVKRGRWSFSTLVVVDSGAFRENASGVFYV